MRIIQIILFIGFTFTFSACDKNTPVTPNPNSGKPEVKLLNPANGSVVSSVVPIQVEATDDKGIIKVEIYIDGLLKKTIFIPPYNYNWDTLAEIDSSLHLIYAKAYDADDNISSSVVSNVIVRKIAAPAALSYAIINDELLRLNWFYLNPSNYSFTIEEAVNNSNFSKIYETIKGVTSADINRILYRDSTYIYRVSAKSGDLYSPSVSTQSINIIIPKPGSLTTEVLSNTSVKLAWSDLCTYETGYQIEKKEGNSPSVLLANLPANSIDYIDNEYDFSIITTYTIKTYTLHNESDPQSISLYSGYKPIISNDIVDPDTAVVTDTTSILTSVNVFDQDGLSDIDKVYFVVYRPNGTTNGAQNVLFDDGLSSHGDLTAGDGIYSLIIEIYSTNTKGIYRLEFQAKDRNGNLSNILNHLLLIN